MFPPSPSYKKGKSEGQLRLFFSETHIYRIMTDLNVWPRTKIMYSYNGPGECQSVELQALILEKGLPEMQRHLQDWLSGSAISHQRFNLQFPCL